ncbi:MAG: N-acetyltransferase [Filomicrobium sp.]
MIDRVELRNSQPDDEPCITELYRSAFPDEDLLPLVTSLLREGVDVLSLVAIADQKPVAHAIFTSCTIDAATEKVALLGPLAVCTQWQRKGIGRKIVQAGFETLRSTGTTQVFVLGDPAYYGRLGFRPEHQVSPPYALPDIWRNAWQTLRHSEVRQPTQGTLNVPAPWRQKSLWLPAE